MKSSQVTQNMHCLYKTLVVSIHFPHKSGGCKLHGFCHQKLVFDDRFNAFTTVTCLFHASYARNSAGYRSQARADKSPIVGAERSGQSTNLSTKHTSHISIPHDGIYEEVCSSEENEILHTTLRITHSNSSAFLKAGPCFQ